MRNPTSTSYPVIHHFANATLARSILLWGLKVITRINVGLLIQDKHLCIQGHSDLISSIFRLLISHIVNSFFFNRILTIV